MNECLYTLLLVIIPAPCSLSNSLFQRLHLWSAKQDGGERGDAAGCSLPRAVPGDWSMPSPAAACYKKHYQVLRLPTSKKTNFSNKKTSARREIFFYAVFMPKEAIERG